MFIIIQSQFNVFVDNFPVPHYNNFKNFSQHVCNINHDVQKEIIRVKNKVESVQYNYSEELKPAFSAAGLDLEKMVNNGSMKKVAKLLKLQTTLFHSKHAKVKKKSFTASDGAEIPFFEISPKEKKERYATIIYFHGGGFFFPLQKGMQQNSALYAKNCGVKVFLPEYRYIPNTSGKRLIDDCYDMMEYVFLNAEALQVDINRVILCGESAGGCAAACVSQLNRDRSGYPLAGQILLYPVCDNNSSLYPSIDEYSKAVWPKESNEAMWRMYLADQQENLEYLVPMAGHCNNLPQAYVEPQEMDILKDEGISYAKKMEAAGVNVELNVIPRSYHGFDTELKSPLVQRTMAHRYEVIKKMIR